INRPGFNHPGASRNASEFTRSAALCAGPPPAKGRSPGDRRRGSAPGAKGHRAGRFTVRPGAPADHIVIDPLRCGFMGTGGFMDTGGGQTEARRAVWRARHAVRQARVAAATRAYRDTLVREMFALPVRDCVYRCIGRPVSLLRAGYLTSLDELGRSEEHTSELQS